MGEILLKIAMVLVIGTYVAVIGLMVWILANLAVATATLP